MSRIALGLLCSSLLAQTSTETRITQLLAKMTLEEKAGQMTQVAIDVVSQPAAPGQPHRLDPEKLKTALQRYGVGSILNVMGQAYSVDHWHVILNQIADEADKTRLKIPVLYGIDSVHGANYTLDAVMFPQAIAVAASWNTALAERAGVVTAMQTRASGIPWNFYPVLDNGRQPSWPRMWETFGEDVHLTTQMGLAYVRGLQGKDVSASDKVAACLKHYAGYGLPFNGKDRTPAILDERTLRQIVLPPYEAAVRAGVPTVMVNSSEISGVPGHANKFLLTDVLKKEWGFQGFTVSDWEDVKRLHTRDRVADSPKAAVAMAVNAGIDMSMVPMDYSFAELLVQAVKEGLVPVARVDDAVRRILRVKFQMGLFERPRPDGAMKAKFEAPAYHQTNLEAAREAITLLKNDGILPLKREQRVLVTGPTADLLSVLNGGWSLTWQGDVEALYPKNKLTLRAAIKERFPGAVYVPAGFADEKGMAAAVAEARNADVIVAAIGERTYCETPGNLEDLTLEAAQRNLVAALARTGKPVVVVYIGGRPRVLGSIPGDAKAFVMAYLPGNEGGRAISDVLYGEVNPSGRLPFSWPLNVNGFTTYDHKPLEATSDNKVNWQWPFGFGLSYTTFEFGQLTADPATLSFKVNVKNSGSRGGKVVVPLYISDLYRSVSPPVKELKAFTKIDLGAGEMRTVEFKLARKDLMFVGLQNRWVFEPGEFEASVGSLKAGFRVPQ